uniref:Uncharacterized protein n=1 Tax=Rhizophora mucronata TaxID=61149 RepID=A0A2P2QTY4_RHIMU
MLYAVISIVRSPFIRVKTTSYLIKNLKVI